MVKYIGYRDLNEINTGGLIGETLDLVKSYPFVSKFQWIDLIKPNMVRWNFLDELTEDEKNQLDQLLANHDKSKYEEEVEIIDEFPEGKAEEVYYETFNMFYGISSTSGTNGNTRLSVKEAIDILNYRTKNNMSKDVYDPNNIEKDAFDYNNFINTPNTNYFARVSNPTKIVNFDNNIQLSPVTIKLQDRDGEMALLNSTGKDFISRKIVTENELILQQYNKEEHTNKFLIVGNDGQINVTSLYYPDDIITGTSNIDVMLENSENWYSTEATITLDTDIEKGNGDALVLIENTWTGGEVVVEFRVNINDSTYVDMHNITLAASEKTIYRYSTPIMSTLPASSVLTLEAKASVNNVVKIEGSETETEIRITVYRETEATSIEYNNTNTGLSAINVQEAIDELHSNIPVNLNDLNDVDVTSVTNNDILQYDNGTWKPGTVSSGSGDMTKEIYDPTNIEADVFDYNNFYNTKDNYITITTDATSEPGTFYSLDASNNSIEFHLKTPNLGDRVRVIISNIDNDITLIADNNIPIDGHNENLVANSEDYLNRLYEFVYTNNEIGWNMYELGAFNRTPAETIVVSINGDDSTMNPNMFSPFKTIKAAIEYAKNIATDTNPVKIEVLPGIYVEENPLIVDNGYVNIEGYGSSTTIIIPKYNDLPLISLSSQTPNNGSDISNIGFYGSLSDFTLEVNNIHKLKESEYILPYKSSKKFSDSILQQIISLGEIYGTSGTSGNTKNIIALELKHTGAYNVFNCDFISFQHAIDVNTSTAEDKIYSFIKNSYFENNDICILTDGQNMNIQFDDVKAYNNPVVINAEHNSFISMSNFIIDNYDIFNETQNDAVVYSNWSMVLLKTGYVFNTGIIIYATNQASVLGDVIDAQNINIAYKCDEASEINIPNTTIETKNITLLIPNTGNNSIITINNLNSRNTNVSEFQLLSFNSMMTVASATLDITKIVNTDIINWANFNVTFNTPGMGNYFFHDVLVGNSLHGSKICIGNGAADYRNTFLIIGPALDAGTNGLTPVSNYDQFEFDTTLADNCLYFTSDSVLNNVPILWHTFTMDIASPLNHNDGGELILEIYDGAAQEWNAINNMVTDGNSPYSSAGKNNFFTFLHENTRIDSFARDYWGRAITPLSNDNKEHYWARIRVVTPFTTKVAIDKVGIMFNTTAFRIDGFGEHFGTARVWNIIPGFDVSMLQQTPTESNGTSVGYWADQEFYIARPLNTMPNGQKTIFNYVINFPTVTDTSSPLMFILKITTNSANGGNFKFKIRVALVQDGMPVYTDKNDAPSYDNRIVEIEKELVAPTTVNTVMSYFIPVDVSNFITIRHSSKLEVIGADTSLGFNISRDANNDSHDGDISIVNIEHHYLQALSGQSSSQFVDVTKNIGKSYKVLYIVNTENYNRLDTTDKEVINIMQSKAFIPTLLKDNYVTDSSWIGYDLIYVSGKSREGKITTKLNNAPIGILINNVDLLPYMNLVKSDDIGIDTYETFINIINTEHYITSGYSSNQAVRITKYARTFSYINSSSSDPHSLASIWNNFNKSNLMQWNKDESDLNDNYILERRVFFGYGDDTLLMDDAVKLISKSLDWLLHFDER